MAIKFDWALELEPRVGTPTWGGPLPRDFLKNPHYPRGYRVGSKPNLPTRYFAEWVNKSIFCCQNRSMRSENDVFLLIRFIIGLVDVRVAKRYLKVHDDNKKVNILYEKHANSHSAIEIPTHCVVPEWASTAKIAHSKPKIR